MAYPLGLLYDLFSGAEPVDFDRSRKDDLGASQVTVETASGSSPLPWKLTIHFTDYPGDQLIQLDADGRAILDSYINAVKEADYIRNGTARTVMSLSKEDSDNLWLSVQNRKSTDPSHVAQLIFMQTTWLSSTQSIPNYSTHPDWNSDTHR